MRKKANIFYLIFILTIILIRIEVFLFPLRKIMIAGLRINHFWIGVIFILLILFMSQNYSELKMLLFPIGFGIMADELIFMIIGGRTVNDYWSIYSVFGVIIIIVIVGIFRKRLIKKIV